MKRQKLSAAILHGLSYKLTSENTGKPPAFAFAELELAALPKGWKPQWKLCGKVPN